MADPAPPALVLHRTGSLAVLRIHDLAYSSIVSVIAQALPSDIHQLMLVTPTDTKMFNLTEQAHAPSQQTQLVSPRVASNGAAHEVAAEESEDDPDFSDDPQAEAIRLAQEGDAAAIRAGLEEAQAEAATAETPAERRAALTRMRRAEGEAGQDATCGRCRGAGQVNMAMPDGGATTSACPVCMGRGTIRRYGSRRR